MTAPEETAILYGGPAGIVSSAPCPEGHDRLIIHYQGRNHRFEFTGSFEELKGQLAPVYTWRYATSVAE
ncbi:DUF5988 family protein [Sinosporangium siamense]|uniref:Uncharacterized protein n=1 Tax=Sinosporangium siamense TaxID=1367973 RepID=A0A919V914_9ACTN|nr:DUF5988 family protein [Sinosporangium siamense]GII94998.1 hypothetical protein Ssi02_52290 [Sinosporangium siamense]